LAVQLESFFGSQGGGRISRMNAGSPQDFIGHPISDAGEAFLAQQNRLDRGAGMALEVLSNPSEGEISVRGWGGQVVPPRRVASGAIPGFDFAEHPGIAEDEVPIFLVENQMLVGGGGGAGNAVEEFAGHAEVDG
jgi:hypothetical protein